MREADGSLKILIASKTNAAVPETNWLPAPEGKTRGERFPLLRRL
ncbi:MAG: DUF1214 domain-containing protein [Deltaproteobacteria bacterium]|nr:DUF1214 domain-containing protein [Deltaproteobacteria bacterium]